MHKHTYFKGIKKDVPEDYLGRILKAELLFHYYPVYNPLTKTVESFMPHSAAAGETRRKSLTNQHHLNENTDTDTDNWLGPQISEEELLKLGSAAEILRYEYIYI
jgi:hypothetical protein